MQSSAHLISLAVIHWGKSIRGDRERVRAGGGINILPTNDHQQVTKIILHMYFSLPGPIQTPLDLLFSFLQKQDFLQ